MEAVAPLDVPAERLTLCVCDLWDDHWCRGSARRVEAMAPDVDRVLCAARERGAPIIHAPSDTMAFYAGHPARARAQGVPRRTPPPLRDPPLPVDASDGGCDSGETPWHRAWTRQHPAVRIADGDHITEHGAELYSILGAVGAEYLLLLGVHTNMCILDRSFAIRQMTRRGVRCILVRDLTDTMYNPARAAFPRHGARGGAHRAPLVPVRGEQ